MTGRRHNIAADAFSRKFVYPLVQSFGPEMFFQTSAVQCIFAPAATPGVAAASWLCCEPVATSSAGALPLKVAAPPTAVGLPKAARSRESGDGGPVSGAGADFDAAGIGCGMLCRGDGLAVALANVSDESSSYTGTQSLVLHLLTVAMVLTFGQ